jgi:hypothetical protein
MPYAAKRQLIHLYYVHFRLSKLVSTLVYKLFSQIGVEFILKWLSSGRNPHQGQTSQQKESETFVSTTTIPGKRAFHSQ